MRDPRVVIRVQKRLRSGASAEIGDPDLHMRENFSGIGPRLAGAGHQRADLLAKIRFIVGPTESSRIATRSPCQAAIIGTCDDGAAADFLAQDAADNAMSGLV